MENRINTLHSIGDYQYISEYTNGICITYMILFPELRIYYDEFNINELVNKEEIVISKFTHNYLLHKLNKGTTKYKIVLSYK